MDFAPMQKGPPPNKTPVPIDLRFGDADVATPCQCCSRLERSGLFIAMPTKTILGICVRCMATSLVKFQETHPLEKLFDVDVDVHDEAYKEAAKAVRDKLPKLSETEALLVAETAIRTLS